jgi:predicted transcriptional regulator
MFKSIYHPKAYLRNINNIKPGLIARTKLIYSLEDSKLTTKLLSEKTHLSYTSVFYHLKKMINENIVEKNKVRPYVWKLTGLGQKRLDEN